MDYTPPPRGCNERDAYSVFVDLSFFTNLTEHTVEIVHDLEDLYIKEDQNAVFMCEVSLENVAGEWYKDGHKIRPTSSIKIRTEGQKKRVLIDDGGRIILLRWKYKLDQFISKGTKSVKRCSTSVSRISRGE